MEKFPTILPLMMDWEPQEEGNDVLVPTSPQKCSKLLQEFDLGEPLGRGGCGDVFKARHKNDDNDYAIKVVVFDSGKKDSGKYRREVQLFAKLNHPHIVRYHNSWIETATLSIAEYKAMKANSGQSFSSDAKQVLENSQTYTSEEDDQLDDYGLIGEDADYDSFIDFADEEDGEDGEDDGRDVLGKSGGDEDTDGGSSIEFRMDINDENILSEKDKSLVLAKEPVKELTFLLIIMELCDKGSLRSAIDDNLYLEEAKLTKYFRQICEGLAHMHKCGIIHRDLKPGNIYLSADGNIKIGDFGLSREVSKASESEDSPSTRLSGSLTEGCGTYVYMAPEMREGTKYDSKVDIYSLGVIYFEMCSPPMTEMEKYEKFCLGSIDWSSARFSENSKQKKILIKSMLEADPEKRPTCEDMLEILNTNKTPDEVKNMMAQNRKKKFSQIRNYKRNLKSHDHATLYCTNFFLKSASEVFELHGAQNLPVPTFVPYQSSSHTSVPLLDAYGNTFSVLDNSRIAFCHYVAANNLSDFRRYSVGKIFKRDHPLPIEIQECSFESISSIDDDVVSDAEIFYMAEEIIGKVFRGKNPEVMFLINHNLLFNAILQRYKVTHNDFVASISTLLNDIYCINELELKTKLTNLNLKKSVVDVFVALSKPINIVDARQKLYDNTKLRNKWFNKAFEYLNVFLSNAQKFGISSRKIFLAPLLSCKNSSGMMCQILFKSSPSAQPVVIAWGNRFDSLLRRNVRNRQEPVLAVGVSFNVASIVKLMLASKLIEDVMHHFIYARNGSDAIPLQMELHKHGIKCKIAKLIPGEVTLIPATKCYMTFIVHSEGYIRVFAEGLGWNDVKINNIDGILEKIKNIKI